MFDSKHVCPWSQRARVRRVNALGWLDYVVRKVRTWLCPGLPRSCSTRAVCTEIMNQSGIPASCGQLKGRGAMPAMGHVPNSCSSSKLVLRSWMLPSLASPVRRRWRPNAGDRSISLLGFRARRCSFSGTVAEPCAWEARCSLDSLRRTVGSGFHLFNNKSDGTRPLNEHVMHFVGLCVLLPMLVGFRPLRTVLLLSLIMAFVSWNCYATVTDVSQMLWLSLGVPITEPRRAVRTGRVLACLAGTSSIQVITRQQLGVVTFVVFSVSRK